jgi:uncharacterized membrane protein
MTRTHRKPLHPPLTDFPVALWITSFAFDVASIWMGNAMVKAAFFNLAAGCLMAVLAAVAGVLDYAHIEAGAKARRVGLIHAGLNVLALAVFGVAVFARRELLGATSTPIPMFVLSAVGVALVGASSYLGGQMVYDLGVNVRPLAAPLERVTLPPREPVKP